MDKSIEMFIVCNETIRDGDASDYLDMGAELADKHQMPVKIFIPYRNEIIVLPKSE